MWKRIYIFYGQFVYFVICNCFPFYLTFSLCILFCRCSEVLLNYNTALQIQLQTRANKNIEILKIFFDIVTLVRKLNQTLYSLSFLIVSYSLQGIFNILLKFSLDKIYKSSLIMSIYLFACSIVMIIAYTLCGLMIPKNFMRIRETVREFLNRYGYRPFVTKQNMFLLKRMESEEIVYISVCELFPLTRGFILSALGTVLTYGLLIINLQF